MSVHRTTVVHYQYDGEQFSYVLDPHGNKSSNAYRYMEARSPPRFPMPAIRYQAEIQDDRVILWTKLIHWTYRYLALKPGSKF